MRTERAAAVAAYDEQDVWLEQMCPRWRYDRRWFWMLVGLACRPGQLDVVIEHADGERASEIAARTGRTMESVRADVGAVRRRLRGPGGALLLKIAAAPEADGPDIIARHLGYRSMVECLSGEGYDDYYER